MMDQMVHAGFNMVFVGIETPDRETLAGAGKTQNLKSDNALQCPQDPGQGDGGLGGLHPGF